MHSVTRLTAEVTMLEATIAEVRPVPTMGRHMGRSSIDRIAQSSFALVEVEPPALDVAAHHVNPPIFGITVVLAQLIQGRNRAIALLIFLLSPGEDLLTGHIFETIDVVLVDIQLEQQAARLGRSFEHERNPLPLREPRAKPSRPKRTDPFRQVVPILLRQTLVLIASRQPC